MERPAKPSLDLDKTNHKTPALIFFGLGIPVLLFASMMRISHLEQSFVYNEEARLTYAKEELFKTNCTTPRKQYLLLAARTEEVNETTAGRMKDIYDSGFKDHKLYKAGEQLSKGEKFVDNTCSQALVEVAKLKRGSSTSFILSNFFGSN